MNYYDQRYTCCETCHYFRDSIVEGLKACGRYAIAFSERGVIDEVCEEYRTESQWRMEEQQREILKKKKH